MATNPRTKNPNDAALSAVEEALRLDLSPEDEAEPDRAAPPRRERRPERISGHRSAMPVRRSCMSRRKGWRGTPD